MYTNFKYNYKKLPILVLLLLVATVGNCAELIVLTYHDIVAEPGNDIYAVSRPMFVAQMDYLQTNGYQVISLEQLDKFRKNPASFPQKAVMLTFDDGLRSYFEFVVPVLKTYGYPSIASVVTGWLDGKNLPAEYHGKLMTWDQVREINKNPLVEIASHSHDLHFGIQANPQGSYEAASITRRYSPTTQSYEDEDSYENRIRLDFTHSIKRIKSELNFQVNSITWPYGLHDNVMAKQATKLGLTYQLALGDGATPLQHLPRINRIMLMDSNNINDFVREITFRNLAEHKIHFAEISLEPFSNAKTLQQQELMLSELLDRLEPLDLNSIVFSPFTSDGSKAFFHTNHLNVAADVANRVVHLLETKLNIRNFYLSTPAYLQTKNLSPVYADLARMVRFQGIVFASETKRQQAEKIKSVLDKYVPNLSYGTFGSNKQPLNRLDFFIAPLDTNQSNDKNLAIINQWKGHPAKMYVTHQTTYPLNNPRLEASKHFFQSLGIQHYGYRLNTDILNDTLPQETIGVANDVSTNLGD